MKKLLLLLALSCVLFSCDNKTYPKYSIKTELVVPDSLKQAERDYTQELISVASEHMTGGDYERPWRTMSKAEEMARESFGVTQRVLFVRFSDDFMDCKYIPVDIMNEDQRYIYDSLIRSE